MPTPTRSRTAVLAGVLAMASSFTGLAAVVAADIAQAKQRPAVSLDDDTPVVEPVTMRKVVHQEVPDFEALLEQLEAQRVDFGTFEGY